MRIRRCAALNEHAGDRAPSIVMVRYIFRRGCFVSVISGQLCNSALGAVNSCRITCKHDLDRCYYFKCTEQAAHLLCKDKLEKKRINGAIKRINYGYIFKNHILLLYIIRTSRKARECDVWRKSAFCLPGQPFYCSISTLLVWLRAGVCSLMGPEGLGTTMLGCDLLRPYPLHDLPIIFAVRRERGRIFVRRHDVGRDA